MEMTISDADFLRLTQFIQHTYGIDLTKKRQLIVSRLSYTIQTMGYENFDSFISQLLTKRNPSDIELVINKLTTNYTFFMREPAHFNFFQKTILPELVLKHEKDRVLSIWSAGCSSGEEPYTIAMYLRDYLGLRAKDWDTRIYATDISQKALSAANEGIYDLPDTIPSEWKRRYFQLDAKSGRFQVIPEIRKHIKFQTFNLMTPIRFPTKFDVIFCRNVMIYFDQPTKDALVQRFFQATKPGGYLLIGHSETLNRNSGYQPVAAATFKKP